MADRRLRAIIEAVFKGQGVDQAEKGMRDVADASDEAADSAGKTTKQTDQLSKQFKKLVAGGTVLAAGHQMLQFGKQSLAAASNAQETTSLLQNSLGPAARQFSEDMEAVADATNRSRFQLEEGAATFVAMSRTMGLGAEASANFSAQLTEVAVDLGSFFNRADSDVLMDLQAALAGSAESLQKYGIDVRETTLKQKALEQGLIESGDTLDRATRAQLILNQTMEQASDAMGDAERTADSYQNTVRGLRGELHDLKVNMGEELMPTTKVGAGTMAGLVQAMNDAIEVSHTLRRAQELGIETNAGLTQGGTLVTKMELERIEALVESREVALDRARAEDILRQAMSDGQVTVEQYREQIEGLTESEERQELISKRIAIAIEEERQAALNAAEAYERRREAGDDFDLQVATEEAENEVGDFIDRLSGRALEIQLAIRGQEDPLEQMGIVPGARPTVLTSQELAKAGEANAEQFSESFGATLQEKLTGVFEGVEVSPPTVDTTPTEMLAEKLGIAEGAAIDVQGAVAAVDDQPVERLLTTTEDAQDALDNVEAGSPYASDVDHNLDTAERWARRLKIALDEIPSSKTVTINTVRTGGTTGASGGGQGGNRQMGGPVSAGRPYVVGEAGPELFVPNVGGRVVPNNQVGDVSPTIQGVPGMVQIHVQSMAQAEAVAGRLGRAIVGRG